MASTWWDRISLRGPTLTLTPVTLEDAEDYVRALGDPAEAEEVFRHLTVDPPATVEQARTQLAETVAQADRLAYVQRVTATGELVGSTSFYEIDPDRRALAIGYTWVARPHWRTRVNTESKLVMLTRAFDGLGAERVVWHTDINNSRSQQAIARLGAQREGVLRHHRIRRDRSWRDTVQYSMLSQEWPAVRDRLQARLDAARPSKGERE